MSDSNNCGNIEELLDAFLDGELNAEERSTVQEHIDACSKCARQLKESERMIKELSQLPKRESSRQIDFSFLNQDAGSRSSVSEKCQPTFELLDAYHDGELGETEKKTVSEHLASCQDCSKALAEIQQLVLGIKSIPMIMPSRDIVESINFDQFERKSNVIPFARKFGIGIGAVAAAAVALVFAFNTGHAPGNSGANIADNMPKAPAVKQTQSIASNANPEQQNKEVQEQPAQSNENIAEILPEKKTTENSNSNLLASKIAEKQPPQIKPELIKMEAPKSSEALNELATIPDAGNMIGADALGIGTDEDGLYDIKI